MSTEYDKSSYDPEKALEGPPAVDPGVYSGIHEEADPQGVWGKMDRYNRKLERKLGMETVSRLGLSREGTGC
jgi:hypothetical protein